MNRCVIIGGGYSLKEQINNGFWQKIENNIEIWSINFAFLFMPYIPNTILWLDVKFFNQCKHKLSTIKCKKIAAFNDAWKNWLEVLNYKTTRKFSGLIDDKNIVYVGGNGLTGFFSLTLAILEGFEEIYLVGMDFKVTEEIKNTGNIIHTHWYTEEDLKKHGMESPGIGKKQVYVLNNNQPNSNINGFKNYNQFHKKIYVVGDSNIKNFINIGYDEFYRRINKEV